MVEIKNKIETICNNFGGLISMFLTCCLIAIYYLKIILEASTHIMCPGADSLKNFYTLRYYVENNFAS